MDNQWNKNNTETMRQTIDQQRRIQAKEEAKLWREVEFPLRLSDALTRLTKNDLSEIRSKLRVRNASSLNKNKLIEVLTKEIPAMIPGVLSRLDEARYAVLKRIANADGQAYVSLEPHEYEYFKLRSLAFTGTFDNSRKLVMPVEVLEQFKHLDDTSLRAEVRKNTEWIHLSHGLLYYYGFLSTGDLIRMVEDYTGGPVNHYQFLTILYEGMNYGYGIQAHISGFTIEDVYDVHQVKREQESRPGVPFYPFTKAQLLRSGKPGFVDKTPAYKALVDFLKHSYQIDLADAEDEADLCIYEIQNGESLPDIVAAIAEEFEVPTIDVLQTLTAHIAQLHNHTRQWFLKGHTPHELAREDRAVGPSRLGENGTSRGEVIHMATKKKVGRNDPCPCGSGKKYKKCCGR